MGVGRALARPGARDGRLERSVNLHRCGGARGTQRKPPSVTREGYWHPLQFPGLAAEITVCWLTPLALTQPSFNIAGKFLNHFPALTIPLQIMP